MLVLCKDDSKYFVNIMCKSLRSSCRRQQAGDQNDYNIDTILPLQMGMSIIQIIKIEDIFIFYKYYIT